jgi:hypothetical protein
LLAENRGVRNPLDLSSLTAEQILEWADAHHQKNGKWPHQRSGAVSGVPGEKWVNINAALSNGRRGLLGGSSLAKLIESKRKRQSQ